MELCSKIQKQKYLAHKKVKILNVLPIKITGHYKEAGEPDAEWEKKSVNLKLDKIDKKFRIIWKGH